MNGLEIFEKVIMPIIQFLIGPIIAGYLVWGLTNRKNFKKEKDDMLRQANEIINSLESLVKKLDDLNAEFLINNKLSEAITNMNKGFFQPYLDELNIVDKNVCYERYENKKIDSNISLDKTRNPILSEFKRLGSLPVNLLPPELHRTFNKIIIKDEVKLDTQELNNLIRKLKKL